MRHSKHMLLIGAVAILGIGFAFGYSLIPSEKSAPQGQLSESDILENEPALTEEEKVGANPILIEEPEPPKPEVVESDTPIEDDLPIELEVCHIPFQIGTYETVTLENAISLAFPILKARNTAINESQFSAQDTNGEIRITIAREFFVENGEDNYCNTWEENNSCIGQWVYFKDGVILMEAQNPC